MTDHPTPLFYPQVVKDFDHAVQALALPLRWHLQQMPAPRWLAVRRLMLGWLLGATSISQAWLLTVPFCPPQSVDTLYDCLKDPQVRLVELLQALVPGYRSTREDLLIVDDTITTITGQLIAGTTWQHDHSNGAEHWGHNLVALYHRRPGEVGCFVDLALKMNRHQPPAQRQSGCPPAHIRQARRPKWELARDLLLDAWNRGLMAETVLVDGGYCQADFLRGILALYLHFITRLPCNRKLWLPDGRELTAQEWLDGQRSYKRLRDTGYYFTQTRACLPGVGWVKLVAFWPVASAKGKASARFLITDRLPSSAFEVFRTYFLRWGIEPGFKESRQVCALDEGHVQGWHAVNNYYSLSLLTHAVAVEMQRQSHSPQGVIGRIMTFRQEVIRGRIEAEKEAVAKKLKTLLWESGYSTRLLPYSHLKPLIDSAFREAG